MYGPLLIGLPVFGLSTLFRQTWLKFSPWSACCGRGPVAAIEAFQLANGLLKTTVTTLPLPRIARMSSQPTRETMSQRKLLPSRAMIVCHVKRKSRAVICRPSYHLAFALYRQRIVNG